MAVASAVPHQLPTADWPLMALFTNAYPPRPDVRRLELVTLMRPCSSGLVDPATETAVSQPLMVQLLTVTACWFHPPVAMLSAVP